MTQVPSRTFVLLGLGAVMLKKLWLGIWNRIKKLFSKREMEMKYKISTKDISDVTGLLNEFLKHISLVTLSRTEAVMANPETRFVGSGSSKYHDIVKMINRWGIKDESKQYNELLNNVIGRISSCHPMLLIYEPVQLLLFNKMLEWGTKKNARFSKQEIEAFFLQSYEMITNSSILVAGLSLNELSIKSQKLARILKSKNSKDFLNEGVVRRLFMLKANVDSIVNIYDEHRIEPIDDNEKTILSQSINSFYANIYAILDCLAFVFAFESPDYKIDRGNKKELRKVGLFKKDFYTKINGLSEKLSLTKSKHWYAEVTDLRHPIAHRIPLYFPEMYTDADSLKIQEADKEYYDNIEAVYKTLPPGNRIDKLNQLQEKWQETKATIEVFSGCFLHSYEESKKLYHLSRLTFDLGILCHLLNNSFDYFHDK